MTTSLKDDERPNSNVSGWPESLWMVREPIQTPSFPLISPHPVAYRVPHASPMPQDARPPTSDSAQRTTASAWVTARRYSASVVGSLVPG